MTAWRNFDEVLDTQAVPYLDNHPLQDQPCSCTMEPCTPHIVKTRDLLRWEAAEVLDRPSISYIFSCDQAALQMVFSVRLSVCPSVTPFWLCSHHGIIMKFSGVITNDQGKVHAKGQGQRSKVKVTEVTTQLNRFRTVTPVWIHI